MFIIKCITVYFECSSLTIELDFLIRKDNYILPIEVKRNRGRATSLLNCINNKDVNVYVGIKLSHQNIGFENNIITLPYFMCFLLKRFVSELQLDEE